MNFRLLKKIPLFILLAGCACRGAPSFPIVGAYFPGWLICLFIGGLSIVLFRVLFLKLGWDNPLTDRFFVYLSLGTIVGLTCWLLWFGE
ncbi:hypothetical protein FAI41_04885 [Acetobacteraceae bacterium]|nr:hypothetical protein FAI41_04885 [Acetobacteraceae bacterium]